MNHLKFISSGLAFCGATIFSLCLLGLVAQPIQAVDESKTPNRNLVETLDQASSSKDSGPLYSALAVLNFREKISEKSKVLDQIPEGFSGLRLMERKGDRALVRYCDALGWVSFEFLSADTRDRPRTQVCDGQTFDPFAAPKLSERMADVDLGVIGDIDDSDGVDATEIDRSLAQAKLSPQYSLCMNDAKSSRLKMEACLVSEAARWQQDMSVAFDLIAVTLPLAQMKRLRNSQRVWEAALETTCVDLGLRDAAPLTKQNIPTCKLNLTFQRAIGLENFLKSDTSLFEKNLFELEKFSIRGDKR